MRVEQTETRSAERIHNSCAQCGEKLLVATWSERVDARCVRYLWCCDACGYQFETTVYLASTEPETTLRSAA